MKKFLDFACLIPALAALMLVVNVRGAVQAPHDRLQLIEKDRSSAFYARPKTDWKAYTRIRLQNASVTFRRNWQRNQNRADAFKVTDKDMERIKTSLSGQVRDALVTELSKKGGYTITETRGPRVLLLKPAIVDLDVVAPDTIKGTFSRQYADSSTRMTLNLEIYDSSTGELLATCNDRLEDPRQGYLEWTDRVANRADANRLLRQWAAGLRKRLEAVRATG